MDTESRGFPPGGIRVSDADRDRAVAELSEHFQAGRLTQGEFEDRSGRALQARTGDELSGLFNDLPQQPAVHAPRTAGPSADLSPRAGGPPRPAGGVPVARVVIAFVVAAIVAGNVLGHSHGFGWLVPVVILSFVFLRLAAHGRRP